MRLTGQSYIYEEMKRRLKLENACCYSIHIYLFHSGVKMTVWLYLLSGVNEKPGHSHQGKKSFEGVWAEGGENTWV